MSHHLVKLADIQFDVTALDRRTVKLAYQIKDFAKTGHSSATSLVKASTADVINYITARQPRPIEVLLAENPDRAERTTQRSRSSSLEPTAYFPIDWPVDKPAFRKALATFVKDTRQLAEDLLPAQNSTTPESSKAATRQTSAEEAIYQQPIGPVIEPAVEPVIDTDTNMADTGNGSTGRPSSDSANRPNSDPRNFNNTGFTQQQWMALQALVGSISTQQGPPGPPGPAGQQGQPGVPGEAAAASSSSSDRWNSADLGYFDPHLEKSYSEGEIVTVGKDLYFRSIILFVERVRDLATIKGDALVRTNLNTSLRGAILR